MTVYCKFIKIPLGFERIGNIRRNIIRLRPLSIKKVTNEETTAAQTSSSRLKEPNIFKEIGAVTVCAPLAAEREDAINLGLNFE